MLSASLFGCSNSKNDEQGNGVTSKPELPLIDVSVPTILETATFALG
jgi:hypothetical protein